MKIESVDFFYFKMPEILDIGDGSQDATLVRVRAGGYEGWGECESSPVPTIAAYVCPMSHSACKPLKYSVEGMEINEPSDIYKIVEKVHSNSFDLLQTDHTLSGIDIALWDLLGKKLGEPVFSLLGYKQAFPKMPYASQLFGDTPELTFEKARYSRKLGYKAVKFGWGPIGKAGLELDEQHFRAAREGLGLDAYLMIDLGTEWKEDVAKAHNRLKVLKEVNCYWLEEPFINMSLTAYKNLSECEPRIPLAAGEGCNNYVQAAAMMDFAGLKFIQIDTGRIGGISVAKRVADEAVKRGITYVNHTFTSHLALSASLQPFGGISSDIICEYPVEPKQLALDITKEKIEVDNNGYINVSESAGLGVTVDTLKLKSYLVDFEINIDGEIFYKTPIL